MKRKNITLFFKYFQSLHFAKDPFLVPYYLGKILDYDVTIIYPQLPNNKDLPHMYRGVRLIPLDYTNNNTIHSQDLYTVTSEYVSNHAREIDVFVCFFGEPCTDILVNTYKKMNPQGKVYIKLDIDPYNIEIPKWKIPFSRIKNNLFRRKFFSNVDVASCETSLAYEQLKSGKNPSKFFGDKLVFVPNGIDEEEIENMKIESIDYCKKDKVIITIGRLGTYQKNTEMFLEAIGLLNLKDWKVYMVGSVEMGFEQQKRKFMKEHPELEGKVIWTGYISDRLSIYKLLNRSRVFALSSLFESYGLVLIEAQRFGNYVVSTPVGAINDIVKNGYGKIVPMGDAKEMAKVLQSIIDEKIKIDLMDGVDPYRLSWGYRLRPVVEKLSCN